MITKRLTEPPPGFSRDDEKGRHPPPALRRVLGHPALVACIARSAPSMALRSWPPGTGVPAGGRLGHPALVACIARSAPSMALRSWPPGPGVPAGGRLGHPALGRYPGA